MICSVLIEAASVSSHEDGKGQEKEPTLFRLSKEIVLRRLHPLTWVQPITAGNSHIACCVENHHPAIWWCLKMGPKSSLIFIASAAGGRQEIHRRH